MNVLVDCENRTPEQLLIRGFGVQVPGGAPVLTWGYARFTALASRGQLHFWLRFAHVRDTHVRDTRVRAPCLLGGRERRAGRLVQNGPIGLDQS